jgi:hypothetical protein
MPSCKQPLALVDEHREPVGHDAVSLAIVFPVLTGPARLLAQRRKIVPEPEHIANQGIQVGAPVAQVNLGDTVVGLARSERNGEPG